MHDRSGLILAIFGFIIGITVAAGYELLTPHSPSLHFRDVHGTAFPEIITDKTKSDHPPFIGGSIELNGPLQLTVQHGQLVGYTSDKRFAVVGEIFDLRTKAGIGANVIKSFRKRQYGMLTESVRFKALKEKLRVEVFFDVNCPYCREMFNRTAEYNKDGISLDYILFPRTGGTSQSYFIAQGIYCAKNPYSSLADAMRGNFSAAGVADTPCKALVKRNIDIAYDLGVIGTPAILFPDGSMHFGILSPSELLNLAGSTGG